ncbi:MAG TPA: enolase C-terminal domain-like protein [Solirubrobacteraceae bacterium]
MSLHDHRISAIALSSIESRYPRPIGCNARLGSHGSATTNHIVIVETDSGARGWGLVKVKLRAGGTVRDAMAAAGLDGPAGRRFFELFDPDVAGTEALVGRRVGDLFDPQVGVTDDAALSLDFALHDLAGRILGTPVHQLLGSQGERSVSCYDGAIYFDDLEPPEQPRGIDAVLANCSDDLALGYRDFKLKIGRGSRWMDASEGRQRDMDVTRAVRAAHPDARILVDANNSYSGPGFLSYLDGVSDCDLFWVEEPFIEAEDDLAALRSHLERAEALTLVADGEGSEADDARLLELAGKGLIDVIQFNIVDYGLTAWRRIMPLLRQLDVHASPHAWGSPINTLYAAQLARGLGNVVAVEGIPGRTSGVDTSGYILAEGMLTVPDEPGFGMSLIDAS